VVVLEVRALRKRWPGLDLEVDLHLDDGKIGAVLGPSGCGKSTLLRLLAGLTPADGGSISLGGRELAGLPPERRRVGMVFQDYALFPAMNVRRNIEYALRLRRAPARERREKALRLAAGLGIGELLERMPYSLSGGEQQRVALARTLAGAPDLVLLDEPLSALDAPLRRRLREETAARIRAEGLTALHVTHDVEEALAVADTIFLMHEGKFRGSGPPEEIYARPPTAWAASFLGRGPVLPLLDARFDESGASAITGIGTFRCAAGEDRGVPGRPHFLFFPADCAEPFLESGADRGAGSGVAAPNRVAGTLTALRFAGRVRRATLSCPPVLGRGEEVLLELELPVEMHAIIGEELCFRIPPERCLILEN
jgi:ABC-type Fe3+/spermidine/putrescine transport system ATPase subunit